MAMTKTGGKTDTQRLAELLKDPHDRGDIAREVTEEFPRLSAKTTLAMVDLIARIRSEIVEEFGAAPATLVLHKAHVPVDWVEYPNGRLGLDSVGNIAEVVLDDPFEVK